MRTLIITLLALICLAAQGQKQTAYDKALALHHKQAYKKALAAFNKEAQRGNLPATYYAAFYSEKGIATDTNYQAAISAYKRIATSRNNELSAYLIDDAQQLLATLLPAGKQAADMKQQLAESAKASPLSPEEIYLYALCREALLEGDAAAPDSKERKGIISAYITAANHDYLPATYRAAVLLEATEPWRAAMYYRWACYDVLEAYDIPKPARLVTRTMTQNTMRRTVHGEPNQEQWTAPEVFEPGPGLRHGEMTILNVTDDHVSFETFMEYVDGSRKATNKFVVNRGEALKLLMTGVSDMRCELHVTYKK